MPLETSQKNLSPTYAAVDNIIKKYINALVVKAEEENARLEKLNSELLKNIKTSEDYIADLNTRTANAEVKYKSTCVLLEEAEKVLINSENQIKDYESLLAQKKGEYDKLVQDISKNTITLQKNQKEIADIKQSIVNENKKLSTAIVKSNEIVEMVKDKEDRITKLDAIINRQNLTINSNEEKILNITKNIENLKEEEKELSENVKKSKDELALSNASLEKINRELDSKNKEYAKVVNDIIAEEERYNKKVLEKEKEIKEESDINKAIIDDLKNKARENDIYRNSLISIASDLLNNGADENKIRNIISKLK